MAKQSSGSVNLPEPFREVIRLLQEGRVAAAAMAFCRAMDIDTEGMRDSAGERDEQACAALCELLSSADFESAVWWSETGQAWWKLGIGEAAKGCITHVRRLALSNGAANWEDLRKLAEIDLSKQPESAAKRDQTATPVVKAWEDHRAKLARLWFHLNRTWDSDNPELENVLGDPVASILVFRKMEGGIPLGRWISFWNDHGHAGVAIDHFFATLVGKKFDEFLFSGDYNYWSLFYLSESFRNTRDPVTAYAALLLLSLTLTSGAGSSLTSQQREDRLSQTRERIKDLDWVAPDFHLYANSAPAFALGCRMADWFVANRLPGRFLHFVGKENLGAMAARSPLLKERFNTMARNGGWVREFIPDLDETLDHFSAAPESAAPFPPSLPAFITQESSTTRSTRIGETAWSIRRPKEEHDDQQRDGSIELNIGLQHDNSVRPLRVRFGQHNPLAIVHSRARQVLPQLISQLIAQGKRVIWIRDVKQDESPADIGARSWSWTRRSSSERANLMTSLGWSPALQETIVQFMASSTHVAFRKDIRTCLDGLLSWIAENPLYCRPNAQRRRFVQSIEQIRKTGFHLDGPGALRRLTLMAENLKSFLDDLCRAVNCETGYYGTEERTPELAVFDSEGEGRPNTLSLLLFVGGLMGLLRKQNELDFKINARPRPQPDAAKESTATLEETQAEFKEYMERKAEKSERSSIIGGTVADMCLVVSVASKDAMNSLVEWLSPGSIGAGACLLVTLDRLPEAPAFLNRFETFVVGSLSDQERHRLRVAANLFAPEITDDSPAAIVTVAPQLGGLAISSGLLWPQDDRRN